ncbi:uncharacterized protein LOC127838944 isoform X1 [Dreissena polymorpha]|nr:uncharacterized protein LOC127838944 isoform X1 [Dreissena polymorpha]
MPNNEIDVSVDAGWQKRGSGRAYDSLSGHCSMVGTKTGKVFAYAVRTKTCRVCSQHKKKGNDPCKLHDCRINWSGSAKAMEPDMVTEMIIETAKKGVKATGIVGDDDTTTAARLKTNVPHMVEKRSDKNHVKKNLANCLYGMQKNFPTLSTKNINYLLKLFNYNISQNKQNPVGISRGMDAVVGHAFDDHSFCDDTWCRFIHNSSAKYSSFPYGRPLTKPSLKAALFDVFGAYKKIAPKLSMLSSTQANESLNKSIASKAPKQLHLSGSANLNFRIAAGVAQKNLGSCYLTNVI